MSDEEEEVFVFSPDPSLLGLAPTPGDWRQHPEHPERIILNGSAGYEIVDAVLSRPPNKADVRLMAAAADLLAACKLALEDGPNGYACYCETEGKKCDNCVIATAISKAEGVE